MADHDQFVAVVSTSVIVLATIMKIPQIVTVLRRGTTKGINVLSLYMEFWCFSQLFAYPCSRGYPLLGYIEFLLLSIQDTFLIFLVWRENKMLTVTNISSFILYVAFVASLALGYAPSNVNYIVAMTVTPISASGKLVQLLSILRNKSAGSVSSVSWAIGFYTAGAKLLTNYLTIYDVLLMVTSAQASILNGSIALAAFIYRDIAKKQS